MPRLAHGEHVSPAIYSGAMATRTLIPIVPRPDWVQRFERAGRSEKGQEFLCCFVSRLLACVLIEQRSRRASS